MAGISMKELADALGVSTASVSVALRESLEFPRRQEDGFWQKPENGVMI